MFYPTKLLKVFCHKTEIAAAFSPLRLVWTLDVGRWTQDVGLRTLDNNLLLNLCSNVLSPTS